MWKTSKTLALGCRKMCSSVGAQLFVVPTTGYGKRVSVGE